MQSALAAPLQSEFQFLALLFFPFERSPPDFVDSASLLFLAGELEEQIGESVHESEDAGLNWVELVQGHQPPLGSSHLRAADVTQG